MSIDPETLIRDYAKRGLSKTETMEALRWGGPKFNLFLSLLEKPVEWAPRNKTLNRRLYRESIKGVCLPYQAENAKRMREAMVKKSAKTVRGFSGSIQEIIDHFEIKTSVSCVRRRRASGMSWEDAFFTPNKPQVCGKATNNGWK